MLVLQDFAARSSSHPLMQGGGTAAPNSTPLHLAAARGDEAMVQLMLTHHMRRLHAEANCADLRALRNAAGRRPVDLVDERAAPMLYQVTAPAGQGSAGV